MGLCFPGAHSYAITNAVTGWEQGLLTVHCHYEPGWENYVKWWCRGANWYSCRILVQTSGSEQEVKKGRMSIKDHQKSRTFSVTMEDLRLDDADTYWCGIERAITDLGVQVHVTVLPEAPRASSAPEVMCTERPAEPAVITVGAAVTPGPDHSRATNSSLTEAAETTQGGQGA